MKRYMITPDQHLKIKNREFLVQAFTIGRNEYQCYSKLMQYIISDSPELMNRESGLIEPVEPVERGEILDIYASAYNEGRGQFNKQYFVDSNTLYGNNADALIRQLDNKLNEKNTGWRDESQSINIYLSDESIRKMGFASGARSAITDLYNQHREIFEKFAIKDESQPAAANKKDLIDDKLSPKHNFPTIDKTKYDAKLIYEKFNNVIFRCSIECFSAWFINGIEHPETIEYILKGRRSRNSGSETLNFAQLRKFIEKITGNTDNTKDAYYKAVFGLNIKTSTITISNQFKFYKELKECEIIKK